MFSPRSGLRSGSRIPLALGLALLALLLSWVGQASAQVQVKGLSRDEKSGGMSTERWTELRKYMEAFARRHGDLKYVQLDPLNTRYASTGVVFTNVPDHMDGSYPVSPGVAVRIIVGTHLPDEASFQSFKERPNNGYDHQDGKVGKNPAYICPLYRPGLNGDLAAGGKTIKLYQPNATSSAVIWAKGNWEVCVIVQRYPAITDNDNGPKEQAARDTLKIKTKAEAQQYAEEFDPGLGDDENALDLKIDLLDANPKFNRPGRSVRDSHGARLPALDLPLAGAPSAQQAQLLVFAAEGRKGAAADGATLLLVRSRLPEKGVVHFHLHGSGEVGSLHPLSGDPFKTQPTELTPSVLEIPENGGKTTPYAFALYRSPSLAWGSGGSRDVQLTEDFTAASNGKQATAEKTFELVRPPVVLVHGTYDNPRNCWRNSLKTAKGGHLPSMQEALLKEGFLVFLLDWEATNGSANPSDFKTNAKTVFYGDPLASTAVPTPRPAPGPSGPAPAPSGPLGTREGNFGGILAALESERGAGYACTQADLVAHSQGGMIAREFIKGIASDQPRSPSDPHNTAPEKCNNCWYHNDPDNPSFHRGSIRRLITISTTHRGSAICRLLMSYQQAAGQNALLGGKLSVGAAAMTTLFLGVADYQQGVYTGGFRDQIPGSTALRAIGASPVQSHAIACVAEDEDMMTVLDDDTLVSAEERAAPGARFDKGYYQKRLELIWSFSSPEIVKAAFEYLGQSEDARRLRDAKLNQIDLESRANNTFEARQIGDLLRAKQKTNPWILRAAAFMHDRNDCTVAESSSLGGLKPPFATTVPHCLHGYAPRYPGVQSVVVSLLTDGKGRFSPSFPDSYAGPDGSPGRPANGGVVSNPKPAPPPASEGGFSAPHPPGSIRTIPKAGAPPLAQGGPEEGADDPSSLGIAALTPMGPEIALADVAPESAAAAAGLQRGDVLMAIDGKSTRGLSAARVAAMLKGEPGSHASLVIGRGDRILNVGLTRPSGPAPASGFGARLQNKEGGVTVLAVQPGSKAAQLGLRPGDILMAVGGKRLTNPADAQRLLTSGGAGPVLVTRGSEVVQLTAPPDLTASSAGGPTAHGPGTGVTPPGSPRGPGSGTAALIPKQGLTEESWEAKTRGAGSAIFLGGMVSFKAPAGERGGLELWSQGALHGDFRLAVHHRLEDWTPKPGDQLRVAFALTASREAQPRLLIVRNIDAAGNDTFEVTIGDKKLRLSAAGDHQDLAITRTGNQFAVLRFDGQMGQWITLGRASVEAEESLLATMAVDKTGAAPLDLTLNLGPAQGLVIENK